MRKRLILNADDYGMTERTVDGIIHCARAGAITSTTVMATGAAFDYGIRRMTELGNISIGVHLDATSGAPLSTPDEAPTLIDDAGKFRDLNKPEVLARVVPAELKTEFSRQIERAKKAGIRVTHLDNHYNWIYFSMPHFAVAVELAAKYGLPLRYPFSHFSEKRISILAPKFHKTEDEVRRAITESSQLMKQHGIQCPDHFWYEFSSAHRTKDSLKELLSHLPDGISEILLHPGEDTNRQRQELAILLAAAEEGLFRQPGLQLVGHGEVAIA